MSIDEYEFFDTYRSMATGMADLDFRAARYMLRSFSMHSKEFDEYWKETENMLKKLFQTRSDIVGLTGAMRLCFDAIISSIVEPGDKVLALSNGYWGNYASRVTESYEGIPILHQQLPTRALDPRKVTEEIEKHQNLKAVTVVHVETDTGSVHPVAEIGEIVKKNTDALFIVDCATSLGSMEVKADEWGADFCFSGSHKGLSSPVGLALIAVSDRAWSTIKNRKTRILGTYNNLLQWRRPIAGESRPPLAAAVVHAVRARLDYIFRHGPEKIYKRHEIAAKALRWGLIEMGLDLLSESPEAPPCSNVVTLVKWPAGASIEKVARIMCERYNMRLGLSSYREEAFQLGTTNESQITPRQILFLLTSLGLAMSEVGIKVRIEQGVRKANEILLGLEETR